MQELKPFIASERSNVVLTGGAVPLEPPVALALGMVVHELTTNAVKYGALSVPEGNVAITWTVEKADGEKAVGEKAAVGDRLVFQWVERNGPAVTTPDHRGFGMTLIERGFAYDVGGDADVAFASEGVVATLRAPFPAKHNEGIL